MADYRNLFASYNWTNSIESNLDFFNPIKQPILDNPIIELFNFPELEILVPLKSDTKKIKEDTKKSIKPLIKERVKKISDKSLKGTESFEKAFEEASKIDPSIKDRKDFFIRTAKRESGFNSTILNSQGAPCYGWFQMHLLNISNLAGVSVLEYINNPVLLILTANKLYNQNLQWLKNNGLYLIGKDKGYSEGAMITGCWLGPVATKIYLLGKGNPSDKHWSKDKKTGVSVGDLMNGWMNGKY